MPPKAAPRGGAARRNITAVPDAPADPTSQNPPPSASESQSTPTAGPSRPPVRRLQSLNKRTPTGSITPAAKPPGLAGEQQKPTLKYKPRAVGRRSKEEREEIERLEAERNRERLAEAAAKQRGRGGAGPRGRGGLSRFGTAGSADGPLGSGSAARRGRGGRVGSDRVSSMSRSRTRSVMGVAGAAGRGDSSDESDNEVRVSMDQINIESSDEEESDRKVPTKNGKIPFKQKREKGLRPVRVEGHEHKERVVSVNMESSSGKSSALREQAKAQQAQDNALFVEQHDASQATEAEPRIKQEPTDDDEVMTDAIPHADEVLPTDDGLLPAQKVKVRRKLADKEPPAVEEQPAGPDPRSLLRTAEDIEEFERHEHDLKQIKDLFTTEDEKPKEPRPEPQPSTEEGERPEGAGEAGEQEKQEEEDESNDKLAGHMFLVQFPPMTPNLLPPKAEEESTDTTAQTTQADGNQSQPPAVKHEEDGVEGQEGPGIPQEPPTVVTATDWQLQPGRVGKMNVHASGRVTLDWGGISFELDRSAEVDFLQEALVMSTPLNGEGLEETQAEDRKVWSMGQLSGKFTVTPDWEAIL